MRTARLVGPTADGTSVVLVTDDGEEIEVVVGPDDPLAQALRPEPDATAPSASTTDATTTDATTDATTEAGDPPDTPAPDPVRRPRRRRETPPMDTTLSPRDIQMRIRGGESLEDLVASSGMDADRVERFAAPVLAEREHLALTALGASVRRRGEASGHRPLRTVVAERLLGQGVDADDVAWDAWKRDDGQWQVSADYQLLDQERHAEFRYDPQGRFSVAEDDDARWLAGERPSPVAAVVDRDDELALVRATSEPGRDVGEDESDDEVTEQLDVSDELAAVLQVVPPVELSAEELAEFVADDPEPDPRPRPASVFGLPETRTPQLPEDEGTGDDETRDDATGDDETRDAASRRRDEAAEPTIAVVRHLTTVSVEVDAEIDLEAQGEDARSALDTLYEMLGGDGYAEESTRVYAGLTDASAVPVVDEHEFEPPAAVQVPAEPGPEVPEPEDGSADTGRDAGTDAPAEPGDTVDPDELAAPDATDLRDERTEPTRVVEREQPRGPDVEVQHEAAAAPPVPDVDEPLIPSPGASRKPGRRKRASVPSWDEIMFGGPKPG